MLAVTVPMGWGFGFAALRRRPGSKYAFRAAACFGETANQPNHLNRNVAALVRGRLENAHDIRHPVCGTAPTVAEPDTVSITDFSAEPYRKVWQS